MISNTGFDVEYFVERCWCFVVKLLDAVNLQRVSVEQNNQKFIESQDSVIHPQHQLQENNTEQILKINLLQSSQLLLEKGFKSYSDLVKKSLSQKAAVSSVTLKNTV